MSYSARRKSIMDRDGSTLIPKGQEYSAERGRLFPAQLFYVGMSQPKFYVCRRALPEGAAGGGGREVCFSKSDPFSLPRSEEIKIMIVDELGKALYSSFIPPVTAVGP